MLATRAGMSLENTAPREDNGVRSRWLPTLRSRLRETLTGAVELAEAADAQSWKQLNQRLNWCCSGTPKQIWRLPLCRTMICAP